MIKTMLLSESSKSRNLVNYYFDESVLPFWANKYDIPSILKTFPLLHILVLPTFEVSITMDQNYILLNDEWLNFTISAM